MSPFPCGAVNSWQCSLFSSTSPSGKVISLPRCQCQLNLERSWGRFIFQQRVCLFLRIAMAISGLSVLRGETGLLLLLRIWRITGKLGWLVYQTTTYSSGELHHRTLNLRLHQGSILKQHRSASQLLTFKIQRSSKDTSNFFGGGSNWTMKKHVPDCGVN